MSFSLSQTTFDCSNIGENTLTLTASDQNGNTVECTSTITVMDTQAPELVTLAAYTLDLDTSGNGVLNIGDLFVSSTDNCDSELTYTLSETNFSCDALSFPVDTDIISNGSFESDLNDWSSVSEPAVNSTESCILPWLIKENSTEICCCVNDILPTHDLKAAFTSFDSEIANTTYTLEQIIRLPTSINGKADLSFDWLGEFDLTYGATIDREFTVTLTDEQDNLIATIYNYAIPYNQVTSINNIVSLDISSTLLPHLGQTIKLKFNAIIPESSKGPAKSLIDDIRLIVNTSAREATVTMTATDASGNMSSAQTIVSFSDSTNNCDVLSTNTFESLQNNVFIYPNPAKDLFRISWSDTALSKLEIYDVNGRFIKRETLAGTEGNKQISIHDLSSGVYFLKISNNNKTIIKKFIKSK